ncbi:MAG: TetR family transcriptional regulator [Candidatus Hydrogenedens sp.]|nr:TetR family transcriptional regulator [Candidatus Hydrogenedens sp.]
MAKQELQREALLESVADHLLAHGLQGASLRPLAAAAGTSDRMLLYYFKDKRELMAEALLLIARRFITLLDASRGEPMPAAQLLPMLAGMIGQPLVKPYMQIWLELVALASRGDETIQPAARKICDAFLGWIGQALDIENKTERLAQAAVLFTFIEGLGVLDAVAGPELPAAAVKAARPLFDPA